MSVCVRERERGRGLGGVPNNKERISDIRKVQILIQAPKAKSS